MKKEKLHERYITCPECGHKKTSSWEMSDDGEVDCDCGATYFYERNMSVDYSSKTIRTEKENK